ncbi:MAG TPA: DUF2281 domain-containing protein [Blastocatellia bacterium]|nr:DUF2281 domain-containing protein [Blastocatellia bacterium]
MTHEQILRALASLSPEERRQVEDFIAFMQQRYGRLQSHEQTETSNLSTDSFIGMWRDREDMQDSSEWVRRSRECD